MPEIGAPSTPAQRQGGAANCKETPPPDHLFSSHDEGSRHGVDFQGLQFSDYRLTDELPTVYDRSSGKESGFFLLRSLTLFGAMVGAADGDQVRLDG